MPSERITCNHLRQYTVFVVIYIVVTVYNRVEARRILIRMERYGVVTRHVNRVAFPYERHNVIHADDRVRQSLLYIHYHYQRQVCLQRVTTQYSRFLVVEGFNIRMIVHLVRFIHRHGVIRAKPIEGRILADM